MKNLCIIFLILFISLKSISQNFNTGINVRFGNEKDSETFTATPQIPGSIQINKFRHVLADLFVEKVKSNNIYYRFTLGAGSYSTSYNFTPNPLIQPNFSSISYSNNESKGQRYNAAFGIGKIFFYKKISLRAGTEFNFTRYGKSTANINFMTDSLGTVYVYEKISSSLTPFNEYNLNYYAALHYNIWKSLAIGFQLGNAISYRLQTQTQTNTTDYYSANGTLTNTDIQSTSIDNKSIFTFFLFPAINIIYNFTSAHKKNAEQK